MIRERAHLRSIATAVPPNFATQAVVADRTRRVFGLRMPQFERLEPVFTNAGIDTRHAVCANAWYEESHTWADRSEVYLKAATELFVAAARAALEQAGISAAEVDTVVTVSSTGIAAPSLEARAAAELGFGGHVKRVPLFGLGCAGGVTGLSLAGRLAEVNPGSNVLVVAVELCSLAVRIDKLTTANIIALALALFADGAAAAVVRTGEGGLAQLEGGDEHSWPDTLDIMGWSVDPQGFGVIFDRSIPPFAEEKLAPAVDGILKRHGLDRSDIDRFICHPGGRKVIEAIEVALAIGPGALDHERAVLARYGNMSAPTALFVLERAIKAGLPAKSMLMALGPGFTLSTAMLSAVDHARLGSSI